MKSPELPDNERLRQAAVDRTALLDSDPEERFDRLTRMACLIFDVPIALVTLVDHNRQWFKSCQGLSVSETSREVSFCGHAIHHPDLFIVEDALADTRFSDNPLVTGEPQIRFYAGAPVHSHDGYRLGTLCLIDRRPRKLTGEQQQTLRELADCVEREIILPESNEAYHALRESEYRARAVIAGTRVGTWQWNVQTGETVFNERWARICGYTLAELKPISIQTWLGLAHPDDLAESERLLQAHFKGETDEYDCRCRMCHRDGHWVWVHDRGRVMEWTRDGEPLMMYGTHADVTEEMTTLQRMEQQNRALEILNELSLQEADSEDELIGRALNQGARFLAMPAGILSEITGEVYRVNSRVGDTDLEPGQTLPLADTYCGLMLRQPEPLAVDAMGNSPFRTEHCYQNAGLESYIGAPVRVRGQLFGTLCFFSGPSRDRPFNDIESGFVSLLARWLSSLLEGRRSRERLSKLAEQVPGVLYQYRSWPDGRNAFPYASAGIRAIYSVSPEQVRHDASPVFDMIHPDDLASVSASIAASEQTLGLWQQQYRVRQNGDWKWVEGRAQPERLADNSTQWHGYISDIDSSKRTQLALQESEEQLRRLFELSPIGIALMDLDTGQLIDANHALIEPTGYSRETFLTMDPERLMPDRFAELQAEALSRLRRKGRFGPAEVELTRQNGERYPALIQGLRIHTSAGRSMFWTLVEDISERKKVERMKDDFISTVSHELRTPLTALLGSLSLFSGGALGPLNDTQQQMISVATRNGDQLRLLINDLLDMEKLVSGRMAMQPQDQRLQPLIDDAMERLHEFAVEHRVSLAYDGNRCQEQARVDARRFQQALTNLLSNAIKFSPPDHPVSVRIERNGVRQRVLVTDQGPGIPESFRPRIFQKFAQAGSATTRSQRGTGLGLAITREIMQQMGGDVGFESEPGQGATFWLDLPPAQ